MYPKTLRYKTKKVKFLRGFVDILNEPVPLWITLSFFALALFAFVQFIGARHEIRRQRKIIAEECC